MGFLSVVAAGLAAWVFGAIWYGIVSKAWMEAAGVEQGPDGRPANAKNPLPYIISLVSVIVVAGMMRHVFALSGIEGWNKGLVSGLGIGLFLATPWLATNYGFAGRPFRLTMIDGAYATVGCALIGLVLTLMG